MSRKILIALVVAVLAAAGGAGWYFLEKPSQTADAGAGAAAANGNYVITARDMTIGDPKAPVVLIEYAAPICPHCAHFNADIFPEIRKAYIDTGKVFYVFRVFPLAAADGVAEKLARCLPKEKYFPFMDQLFRNQQQWDPEYGIQDVRGGLLKQAQLAGMSEDQFNACVASTKEDDAINQVAADGQSRYSITGTPALIVNGVAVSPGSVPSLDQMKGFLDSALASK
ncbi:MAG TPA: thioredoxin domain-containing protein [Rhizomicrobium sp.]|nr:thioredoxin domain-containing protein [Rhizomicrobium sp.]